MRYLLGSLASLFLLTGCGSAGVARRVPDVRGERLDVAERRLEARGLDFEEVGGGAFGIVDRDNWTVCSQEPASGKRARTVRLVVERDCPFEPPAAPGPPRVVGLFVAPALARLRERGVEADAFTRTGKRVERGRWVVCAQWPRTRRPTYYAQLTVARRCTRR
jgi:hypothetical protein